MGMDATNSGLQCNQKASKSFQPSYIIRLMEYLRSGSRLKRDFVKTSLAALTAPRHNPLDNVHRSYDNVRAPLKSAHNAAFSFLLRFFVSVYSSSFLSFFVF